MVGEEQSEFRVTAERIVNLRRASRDRGADDTEVEDLLERVELAPEARVEREEVAGAPGDQDARLQPAALSRTASRRA